MAVAAIRLADGVNAVSALHEEVARKMWHNLWPQVPADEVPIGHVTNGIHVRSWLSPDMSYVLERYLSSRWFTRPADQSVWEGVMQIPDEELWRAHERCRERLVAWTPKGLKEQFFRPGPAYAMFKMPGEWLRPKARPLVLPLRS